MDPRWSRALVIGIVGATLGLILKILLLPFIFITLGVVCFLINGMMPMASKLVRGSGCAG